MKLNKKKETLLDEYKNEGLTIIDLHLGLRLAKPIFINTIVAIFITFSYLIFFYALYQTLIVQNTNTKIEIATFIIFIVIIARYIAKLVAYTYLLSCLLIVVILLLDIQDYTHILMKYQIYIYIYFSIFIFSIFTTLIVYRTNRNIIIKDGVLSIPASDVEQSIFAYIILKPFWGLFYRRNILLNEIISVKNDGYGSKKKDIYPITVTDVKSSNRLIFTSRQKRDEFKTKISVLLDFKDYSGSSFGESE